MCIHQFFFIYFSLVPSSKQPWLLDATDDFDILQLKVWIFRRGKKNSMTLDNHMLLCYTFVSSLMNSNYRIFRLLLRFYHLSISISPHKIQAKSFHIPPVLLKTFVCVLALWDLSHSWLWNYQCFKTFFFFFFI